jgi:hypothetical protein
MVLGLEMLKEMDGGILQMVVLIGNIKPGIVRVKPDVLGHIIGFIKCGIEQDIQLDPLSVVIAAIENPGSLLRN